MDHIGQQVKVAAWEARSTQRLADSYGVVGLFSRLFSAVNLWVAPYGWVR
jgi:hypothetical protein